MTWKCQGEETHGGKRPRDRKGLVCLRNSKETRVGGREVSCVCGSQQGQRQAGLERN